MIVQREIIQYQGSDILRQKAKKVEIIDTKVLSVLEDMAETLKNVGGNGLAAPQVGVLLRLIVVKIETNYVKLINPTLIKSVGEQISLEGCLSLPGIYVKIKRPEFAVIEALDINGKRIELKALNRRAPIFAHEIDHLEGILLIDKAIQIVTYKKQNSPLGAARI